MNKEKGKKSEKKLFIIFLIVLLLSCVSGYFVGMASAHMEDGVKAMLSVLANNVIYIFPTFYVGINALVILGSALIYLNARMNAGKWDGESEDVIDDVEKKLNWALIPINILFIADVFFYGVIIYISEYTELGTANGDVLFAFGTIVFVISYAMMVLLSKLIVDLVKKLNPEKRGSVFDFNFQKEWEASCDEAEKQIMYKAAYKAYHAVNAACMIMWAVSFMGMLVFQAGLLPMFCVTAIWGTLITTFSVVCARMEGKR